MSATFCQRVSRCPLRHATIRKGRSIELLIANDTKNHKLQITN